MATIVTRETGATAKGSPLTNAELDNNFINLNTELGQKLPLSGGTITGTVTFPSSVSTRPKFPGGLLSLSTGDGDCDVWGISGDYYPSNTTVVNAYGIQWSGTNNTLKFIGGGTAATLLSISLDTGTISSEGNISATGTQYGGLSIGEVTTNYDSWNRQVNIHGLVHSRLTIKTANVRNGLYSHDSWFSNYSGTSGAAGLVGTYTNHNLVVITNASARAHWDTLGNYFAATSVRSPLFYDLNDTAYYVDPAGTSVLNAAYVGGHLIDSYNTSNIRVRTAGAGTASGLLLADSGNNFRVQIYGDGSNYGFLGSTWGSWDIRKVVSGVMYMNNNTTYYLRTDSDSDLYRVYAAADMRAPAFYDRDNTSYYVDSAGTSNLNDLIVKGDYIPLKTHSGSDFVNGTLVTTNIVATGWAGDSFVLEATGKSYSTNPTFSFMAQGYLYNDTIINTSGIHHGYAGFSTMKVFENGGYLCFWWPRVSYWNSFEVRVRNAGGSAQNRVTSITDAAEPTGTKKITITMVNAALYGMNANVGNLYMTALYDTNNTSYYVDPASTSILTNLALGTTSAFSDKRLMIDAASNMHAMSALSSTYGYATLEVINTDSASTRQFQVFRTARGSGTIGSITGDAAGTGTTYNTTSDYRLKTNIVPIVDGKKRILKLNPVRHGWVANTQVVVDGFLAHEAQESGFEYAVTGVKDGDEMQSMDYGRISPTIVAALQDAFKEIEELRAELKLLKESK